MAIKTERESGPSSDDDYLGHFKKSDWFDWLIDWLVDWLIDWSWNLDAGSLDGFAFFQQMPGASQTCI